MSAYYDVLIVGSGHGGAHAALALRQAKFTGSVAIVGEESDHPYERPPLSKDYLSGKRTLERLHLRPIEYWRAQGVDLLLGNRVSSVSPKQHTLRTDAGQIMGYGILIWATGGNPRQLNCPGGTLKGVHTIRRRTDVDRIRAALASTRQVVIVGGGFIGLETAAELIKLGKEVCVLETLDRVLARISGAQLSRFYENEHRSRGVDLRVGARIESILGEDSHVTGVKLHDGTILAAQMVIAGIGIVAATEPLTAAGASGTNGLDVDEYCRTNLEKIYAIGDCVAQANPFADGAVVRIESIQNATDQANLVARIITGGMVPKRAVRWFWSNQFDIRLQTAGLSIGHDGTVLRGDPATGPFSVIYLKNGCVIALDCVNSPADFTQGRALVIARARIDAGLLADTTISLKAILETAAPGSR